MQSSPKRTGQKTLKPESISPLIPSKGESYGSSTGLGEKSKSTQGINRSNLLPNGKVDGPVINEVALPRRSLRPAPPSNASSIIAPAATSSSASSSSSTVISSQLPNNHSSSIQGQNPTRPSAPPTPTIPASNSIIIPSNPTSNTNPSTIPTSSNPPSSVTATPLASTGSLSGFFLPDIVSNTASLIRRNSNPFLLLSARRGSREILPADAQAALAGSSSSSGANAGANTSANGTTNVNAGAGASAVGSNNATILPSAGVKASAKAAINTVGTTANAAPNTRQGSSSVVAPAAVNAVASTASNTPVAPQPSQPSTISMLLGAARRASSRQVVPVDDNVAPASEGPEQETVPEQIPSSSGTKIPNGRKNSSSTPAKDKSVLCCDKCDGKHETEHCPHYKKGREAHPDAQKMLQKLGGNSNLPGAFLKSATIVRQPGDGSCLFHSMCYGLKDGSSASSLRAEICSFIQRNPNMKISDTPLQDWVKWDTGMSVAEYARKMSGNAWGGGIEMACVSQLRNVNVHVYEVSRNSGTSGKAGIGRESGSGFKRISAFDCAQEPERRNTVRVLYCGGVHYEALVAQP